MKARPEDRPFQWHDIHPRGRESRENLVEGLLKTGLSQAQNGRPAQECAEDSRREPG
jgi:hypothetical protein